MECNILDSYGNIDINDKIIENCDYIMAGYHFASTPTSLKSMFNHCNNYMIKNEKSKEIIIPHGNHSQDHFFEGKY